MFPYPRAAQLPAPLPEMRWKMRRVPKPRALPAKSIAPHEGKEFARLLIVELNLVHLEGSMYCFEDNSKCFWSLFQNL